MFECSVGSALYVGPASVTGVRDGKVLLAMPDRTGEAELALAFPYAPRRGDVVLAFGDEQLYVIGVLRAQGEIRLNLPGNALISAAGRLRLAGADAVEIEAPQVRVRADRVETAARAVFERVIDAYRWVTGVAQTTAGRVRTLVSGTATLQAQRIQETATKDVRIDGERINLG